MTALPVFWTKVTIRRTVELIKAYPAVCFGLAVLAAVFVYAFANRYISLRVDRRPVAVLILLMLFFSLFGSLKKYDPLPVLVANAKTNRTNKKIIAIHFFKKALTNNIACVPLFVLAYTSDPQYALVMVTAMPFLITLSFSLSWTRNVVIKEKTNPAIRKIKISPSVKSILHDYASPSFLSCAALSMILYAFLLGEFFGYKTVFTDPENRSFFNLTLAVFSLGSMGILGSVESINWKFHAALSPRPLGFHVKRAMLFLLCVFGWMLGTFIIVGGIVGVPLMLKYLLCLAASALTAACMAFTLTPILIKGMLYPLIVMAIVWIAGMPIWFLPLLPLPPLLMWLKAKNEYGAWYLS
ncbi:MAG: hypothetical protein FWD94_08790 [Treponema sp.]|nr:hypothetical protein [Treponema sp.]